MLLAADPRRARRPAFAQFGERALCQRQQVPGVLVAALGLLLHGHDTPLETFEIGEHQLRFDGGDVRQGIDAPLDMGHVSVLETANDVGDRVAFANGGEKLVAEALALRGAADEARDIDEGEAGRNDLPGGCDFRQGDKTRVGHRDVADVGFDRAERVIGRLRRGGLRQRVE